MTHEEAQSKAISYECKLLINTIFDDINLQTCENCEHFVERSVNCFIMPIDIQVLPNNFGCNKFERKEVV